MNFCESILSEVASSDRSVRVAMVGGPATGKTSVVRGLGEIFQEASLVSVAGEAARSIIEEGEVLPGDDLIAFQNEILRRSIEAYDAANNLTFYDRAIADCIVYPLSFGAEVSSKFREASVQYKYDLILYFPFWAEIFENDEARTETLVEAQMIGQWSERLYMDEKISGPCVKVPVGISIEDRIEFCLREVLRVCYGFEIL